MFKWLFDKYPINDKVYVLLPLGKIIPTGYYDFREAEKKRKEFCDKSGITEDRVKIVELKLQ